MYVIYQGLPSILADYRIESLHIPLVYLLPGMLVRLRPPNLTLCYAKEKRVGVRVRLTTFVHLFTEYPMESDGQMEVEQVPDSNL